MQKKLLLLLHTILLPNGKETKMYEITRNHEDTLDYYMSERMAYPNAVYDFTFENRYLIYHAPMRNELAYIALDMKTGLSSEICSTQHGEIPPYEYEEMIPQILYSINPEWEFAGLYADEGISGTRADKRPQFKQMIKDCLESEVDWKTDRSDAVWLSNLLIYVRVSEVSIPA